MKPLGTLVLAAVLITALSPRVHAQSDDYPNRPVTFIVPFAPGGVTGLFARLLGQKLEQRLGKPFVVDHRPGGGGVTGATAVARAAPDGYNIMMASSTILAFNATVRKNLAYDPRKDLTPIALLARVPFVLVVNPALPVNSVDDLVKLAKEKPGQLSFASPGPGTFHHLNAEMFKSRFGVELTHVPYKGTAPALQDIIAGHVSFMFADVPPLAEVGMPGYDASSWHTITTTGGVPKPIVDKLYGEIRAIMAEREVQDLLVNDGALPQVSPSPEEMRKFVLDEIVRWGDVITKAGIAGSQ